MNVAEILNEIHRMPTDQQLELKKKLLREYSNEESENGNSTQESIDRVLLEDGFLVRVPRGYLNNNIEPAEITGKPISETIIEERR